MRWVQEHRDYWAIDIPGRFESISIWNPPPPGHGRVGWYHAVHVDGKATHEPLTLAEAVRRLGGGRRGDRACAAHRRFVQRERERRQLDREALSLLASELTEVAAAA